MGSSAENDAGCATRGDDVVHDDGPGGESGVIQRGQVSNYARIRGIAERVSGCSVDADAVGRGARDDVPVDDELALLAWQVGIAAKVTRGRVGRGDESLVGVERAEDLHVSRSIDQCGVFGAAADLELVGALEGLGWSSRRSADSRDARVHHRTGHHLAAFGQTDDDVIDVKTLELVVLAALGTSEVAGRVGEARDRVDSIARGIDLGRVELASGVEVEP